MKLFQYPKPGKKKAEPSRRQPTTERAESEELGLIHGRQPGSTEEWRVAVALWALKVEFEYQVPIHGGWLLRGGQVLDFLVYLPFRQPVQVFGEYWHESELNGEERLKLDILAEYYNVPEVVILWGRELKTQAEAIETVRRKLIL